MQTLFSILVLMSSLGVIISVLLQEGDSSGLGALGGEVSDSGWGKNTGASKDSILRKITIISATIFIIATIVLAAS